MFCPSWNGIRSWPATDNQLNRIDKYDCFYRRLISKESLLLGLLGLLAISREKENILLSPYV